LELHQICGEKAIGVFLIFNFKIADFDCSMGKIPEEWDKRQKNRRVITKKEGTKIVIDPSLPLARYNYNNTLTGRLQVEN